MSVTLGVSLAKTGIDAAREGDHAKNNWSSFQRCSKKYVKIIWFKWPFIIHLTKFYRWIWNDMYNAKRLCLFVRSIMVAFFYRHSTSVGVLHSRKKKNIKRFQNLCVNLFYFWCRGKKTGCVHSLWGTYLGYILRTFTSSFIWLSFQTAADFCKKIRNCFISISGSSYVAKIRQGRQVPKKRSWNPLLATRIAGKAFIRYK